MWKKVVLWVVVVGAVLAVAIQFVPYGRDHSNPSVVQEPVWPVSTATATRRCGRGIRT